MNFKEKVKAHQIKYKKNELGLAKSGLHGKKKYEHILSDQDGLKGANFYCYKNETEWNELKHWANGVNFKSNGLKNTLRSEHIPFNLFFPLAKLKDSNNQMLSSFIGSLVGQEIKETTEIKIEFAGGNAELLLKDRTSFDAYIQCLSHSGEIIGLGIEVKYTEKSYPFTYKERAEFNNPNSVYYQVANWSKAFNNLDFAHNAEHIERTRLKQPWRNHLLGLAMCKQGLLSRFYSVHLYPEFNTYQGKVVKSYQEKLSEVGIQSFVPLTFEQFIAQAKSHFADQYSKKWLPYLQKRYVQIES